MSTALRRAVKDLLFGGCVVEIDNAASLISTMARDDPSTCTTFADLGVVPALVSMLDSRRRRRLALQSLFHLSSHNFTNKTITMLMLESGILSKIPKESEILDEDTRHEFAQLLLSITCCTSQLQETRGGALIPFLTTTLQSISASPETKQACMSCLYNLSTVLQNSPLLISNRVVDILLLSLSTSHSKHILETSLATLANLVVTFTGKKALEDHPLVPDTFIHTMANSDDHQYNKPPKCQELSAYILMILAHHSSKQRRKMANSCIVPVLVEVALLGTPLTQKRALKLLQWVKDQRQGPHSGPLLQTDVPLTNDCRADTNDHELGKRMMKKMVRQSLNKNMEVITQRANATNLKSLIVSSSSKSLPY